MSLEIIKGRPSINVKKLNKNENISGPPPKKVSSNLLNNALIINTNTKKHKNDTKEVIYKILN